MINRRLHSACAVVVGLALTIGACASNQPQSTVIARNPQNVVAPPTIVAAIPTAVPVFGTATPTAPAPGLSTATPVPAAVAPTATAAATATPTSTDGLPGVAIAVPISEGARLAVVGIEAGSSLNVRELPGVEHPVTTSLSVAGQPAIATGRARLLDNDGTRAIWYEITTSDAIGWASGSFLAPLAGTQPTSRWAEIGLAFDSAEQAVDGIRAAVLAQPTGGPQPTVVVVTGPSADGDRTSVTIDIVGFLDDSVLGERLRIIGEPGPRGSFVISGIESTSLCRRGSGSGEGLCP